MSERNPIQRLVLSKGFLPTEPLYHTRSIEIRPDKLAEYIAQADEIVFYETMKGNVNMVEDTVIEVIQVGRTNEY